MNLRFKWVGRWSPSERQFRFFRVMWETVSDWWAVDKDGNALFYKSFPQCNMNKAIIEHIAQNYPEPTTAQFLPWAYLQFDISDYCA